MTSENLSFFFSGTKQSCVDSLTFETMIPKTIDQRYVSLLLEHRRIILCGPSGTGKTYLAQKLAEHVVLRWGLIHVFFFYHNLNLMFLKCKMFAGHNLILGNSKITWKFKKKILERVCLTLTIFYDYISHFHLLYQTSNIVTFNEMNVLFNLQTKHFVTVFKKCYHPIANMQ